MVTVYNPDEVRLLLCFCHDLDLEEGVNDHHMCKTCGKHVRLIQLEEYTTEFCECRVPVTNEFFFCEGCTGVVRREDGTVPEEVYIVLKRILYIAAKYRDSPE
jgi:hypothetical protein